MSGPRHDEIRELYRTGTFYRRIGEGVFIALIGRKHRGMGETKKGIARRGVEQGTSNSLFITFTYLILVPRNLFTSLTKNFSSASHRVLASVTERDESLGASRLGRLVTMAVAPSWGTSPRGALSTPQFFVSESETEGPWVVGPLDPRGDVSVSLCPSCFCAFRTKYIKEGRWA